MGVNKKTLMAVLLALGTTSCANMAGGRGAQDPVMLRLQSVESRTDQLERQVKNLNLASLGNDVNDIQAQIRELRGQIEQLSFEVESNKRRIRELYLDLDQRVSALEGKGGVASAAPAQAGAAASSAAGGGAASGGASVPPSDAERQAYLGAFNQLKSGQYEQAVSSFKSFLKQYPASGYADNAWYWMGEAEYVNRQYDQAMSDFQSLVSKYPGSAKIPGALLKIGYIQYEQSKYDQARQTLNALRKKYPDSTAASLAQKRLQRMQQEGR